MIALLSIALLAGPAAGQPLPWFAGWSAADTVINRDHVVAAPAEGRIVVLFATWCAPCARGIEALMRTRRAGRLHGVDLTFVACGEPPATVKPWLAKRGVGDARVIYDRFGAIARDLGVERAADGVRALALPRVIVTDRAGVVRAVLDGADAHHIGRIEAALKVPGPVKAPAGP